MSDNIMTNEKVTESERLIHTPSSYARKNLIFVQETGELKSIKQHSCVRENLESYLLFVVTEGKGKVETAGREYEAKAGDVVFLDCRKRYSHTSDANEPWTIRWIHFDGQVSSFMFSLFEEANEKNPVWTPADGTAPYNSIIDELSRKLDEKNILTEINQSKLLNDLLIMILNDTAKGKSLSVENLSDDAGVDGFASLRESVNEHLQETGFERILSIQYGVAPEKLDELFTERYGISLPDYILNRKLNKAKQLLRFTIKPIEEIVEESGLENEAMLRELFMNNEEMTPEDYRRRWAQWIKS